MTLTRAAARQRARMSNDRKWATGFALGVVGVFLGYQFVVPHLPYQVATFVDNWLPLTSLNEASVYVILALGLNIVVGYAGLLDLGFVAFWAIGGYVVGWLMSGFFDSARINILGHPPIGLPNGVHISFWLVLVLAGGFCALWGVIIGWPTLRLKSDYLALVTLGFGEIIPQVFVNGEDINGFNLSNGSKGITPVDGIDLFGKVLGPFDLALKFLIYASMAAFVVLLSLRLREGRLGRAWLAIREDELAASMMGVPLRKTKLAAYAVGAFSGGLGGAAFATQVNGVFAERFNFSISIILLAMVVLGGMGNVWGVIVGALALAWINSTGLVQIGRTFNDAFGTQINFPSYNFLLFGIILILMMLFRREGLIPESRTKLLLREPERGQMMALGADAELAEAEAAIDTDHGAAPPPDDPAPPGESSPPARGTEPGEAGGQR
ncbi:MAG: branched-chain amino acid ABC transporter permease [Actinomycetales bacterium]|nr:branched-chain amino acid ABC transporter permease [Actinomycetales bacterium]